MFKKSHFISLILFLCLFCTVCGMTPQNFNDTAQSQIGAVVIPLFGEVSTSWVTIVKPYFMNPKYSIIVLWIESPGGGATSTKIISHEINVLKKTYNKTVIVYTERALASGAYWIACSVSDQIFAAPSARVGSIGVYMIRVDATKYLEKEGLILHYIASNSHKVRGNAASTMTEEEAAYWQARVDKIYKQFINVVWNGRAPALAAAYCIQNKISTNTLTTPEEFKEVLQKVHTQFLLYADGSAYDSDDALTYGLIDQSIYFDEMVALIRSWGFSTFNADGVQIFNLYIPVEED